MVELYKLGKHYYNKLGTDKNSGMFEYYIIAKELDNIKTESDVLIILNGLADDVDKQYIDNRMKNADKSIFIMSDSVALYNSLDIINNCDYCLHQAPNYKFSQIKCKQRYSYVPELFYKHNIKCDNNIEKIEDKIIFGGNNLNRQDKFEEYNVLNSKYIDSFVKLYSSDNKSSVNDKRLPYVDYFKKLSNYKYSLIICREDYRECSWLTSRFFESIAADCFPIVDIDYDKDQNITLPIKTSTHSEMIQCMRMMELNDNRENAIKYYKEKIENRQNKFKMIINQIIEY